jgi:hypothetical protein
MARSARLHQKAEYICADLSFRPQFSLAVARRTIHIAQVDSFRVAEYPEPDLAVKILANFRAADQRSILSRKTPSLGECLRQTRDTATEGSLNYYEI